MCHTTKDENYVKIASGEMLGGLGRQTKTIYLQRRTKNETHHPNIHKFIIERKRGKAKQVGLGAGHSPFSQLDVLQSIRCTACV